MAVKTGDGGEASGINIGIECSQLKPTPKGRGVLAAAGVLSEKKGRNQKLGTTHTAERDSTERLREPKDTVLRLAVRSEKLIHYLPSTSV